MESAGKLINWLVKPKLNMSCNNLLYKVSTWKSTNIAIQPKLPLETTTRLICIAVYKNWSGAYPTSPQNRTGEGRRVVEQPHYIFG